MNQAEELRLEAWRDVSGAEADAADDGLRREMLALLQGDEDPFDPARSRHVGVSALVTTRDNTDVLLCRPVGEAIWGLPTGHVLLEDDLVRMAALRVGRALLAPDDPAADHGPPGLGHVPPFLRRERCGPDGAAEHLSLCCKVGTRAVLVPAEVTGLELRWFPFDALPPALPADLVDRLAALRDGGTSRERNQMQLRKVFGLRADLPWVREVLRREGDEDPDITYGGGMAHMPMLREEADVLARVEAAGERLGEASALVPAEARGGVWQDGHSFVVASTLPPDDALAARMTELLGVEVRLVQVEFSAAELERAREVVGADGDLPWSSFGVDAVRNRVVVSSQRPDDARRLVDERYPQLAAMVEVAWHALDVRDLPLP